MSSRNPLLPRAGAEGVEGHAQRPGLSIINRTLTGEENR
jgi:hypothetical protein